MADEGLKIKISGDPSDYKAAITEAATASIALNETLKNLSEIA